MAIHTIRLRAPWKLARTGDRDLWQRAFGRPTNLSGQETVRLVVRSVTAEALAALNGKVLGPVPAAYDVTGALEPRNTLAITMSRGSEAEKESREPPFDVWIEIASGLPQDDPIAQ